MAETVLNQQESKIEQSPKTQQKNSHFKRVLGIILAIVMIALTVYVLNLQNQNSNTLYQSTDLALTASNRATINYRTYVDRYKETKVELDETTRKLEAVNRQLDQVTTELESTKGMLTQTQGMLVSAQEENVKLKQQLQGLDDLRSSENVQNIDELQSKIKTLRDNDSEVSLQLAELKGQLHTLEGNFTNLGQGQSLIALFQNRIRLVKKHMHYLKQEAFLTRMAAQKEKDRIAALNGNSGFIVRNGQVQNPNGTKKSFAINVNIVQ